MNDLRSHDLSVMFLCCGISHVRAMKNAARTRIAPCMAGDYSLKSNAWQDQKLRRIDDSEWAITHHSCQLATKFAAIQAGGTEKAMRDIANRPKAKIPGHTLAHELRKNTKYWTDV
jgi:hypothetical protein